MQDMTKPTGRIGIFMGGCSSEREISLKSGTAIYTALKEAGCDVVALDLRTEEEKEIIGLLKRHAVDLVFIALHGRFGEDGTLQAILEKQQVPFTGSDSLASQKAMNKIVTQNVLSQSGILVPPYKTLSRKDSLDIPMIVGAVGLPLVVKPAGEGSSIGITIVTESGHLRAAMDAAFQYGHNILLERYIKGKEITAGILGQEALALIEIRPHHAFFNFQAKYEKGLTDYIIPAEISLDETSRIQQAALDAFRILGCRDFARADFILDQDGRAYFLEMNTIPGFTATSLLPKAAKVVGYEFGELCLKIVQFAFDRRKHKAVSFTPHRTE